MELEIKLGMIIHIKPILQTSLDGMQGRFAPRVATYGKVLYISNKRWVLVGVLNKYGKQIFKECFFIQDIEPAVNSLKSIYLNKKIS